jgi:peptidoglycan/xylan/chitin deacetylase (PgdA/CDA1 family)
LEAASQRGRGHAHRWWRATALALLAPCILDAAALAQSAPRRSQCFTREQLAARPGENGISKYVDAAHVPLPAGSSDGDPVPSPWRGSIRRVELAPGVNKIAFTFDLCEQPNEVAGYDGAVVDVLREYAVRATFFGGGKWITTHPQRARQLIADPLFEMGNHTWEHRNLRLLSGKALHDEIAGAQIAYARAFTDLQRQQCLAAPPSGALGIPVRRGQPTLFRFPFGACNPESLRAVADAGLLAIQWDVSSGDPTKGLSAAKMAEDVARSVRPGSIVLFHANGRGWQTAKALRLLIPALRRRNFEFVTVTELLNAEGARPVITPTCFDSRPGDTLRYDGLAARLEAAYQSFSARFAPAALPRPLRSGNAAREGVPKP